MAESGWIQTDEYQWVTPLSKDVFHVLEGTRYPHGSMTLMNVQVDLREYSQEQLEDLCGRILPGSDKLKGTMW